MAGIRDIAKRAGVSIGTVDRVLHQRGRYAEKTRTRVLNAAARLDYKPNLTARSLRRNESCRLAVLHALPEQDQGFWTSADEGIAQAQKEFNPFNVKIDLLAFDRYDKLSFQNACAKARRERYQGVLLAPLLQTESRAFVLANPTLPIVCFDCPLDGVELVQSLLQDGRCGGQTVAGLFSMHHAPGDRLAVIGYQSHNIHIRQRMEGFCEELNRQGFAKPDEFLIPDELDLRKLRLHLEQEGIDLFVYDGIFVAKTGTHKYARILNADTHNCFLIGYDLPADNLRELRSGRIDALISQNSAQQIYQGLRALVNHILYGRPAPTNRIDMPADIVTRHNVDAYLAYHQ